MIKNRKIYFRIDRKSSIMFGNCFRFAELYWKNEVLVSIPSSAHPLDWSGRREGSARVLKQGKLRRP